MKTKEMEKEAVKDFLTTEKTAGRMIVLVIGIIIFVSVAVALLWGL